MVTDDAGATEFTLALSDRGEAVAQTGDLADARRIQSVLFGRPRAGDANFGFNATSYIMEIADAQELASMQTLARSIIGTYLPNVLVRALVVEQIPSAVSPAGRGTNSLVIGISLGTSEANSFPFVLVASAAQGGGLVSQLVL